jgi:uncharacterized membrane protein
MLATMRYHVVLLVGVVACSDATQPMARPFSDTQAIAGASVPFATNVHTASIPIPAGCIAMDLNNIAEVVGSCGGIFSPNTQSYAFKWQADRGATYLTFQGDTANQAFGVNNKGQVAIGYGTGNTPRDVAIWDWFGNLTRRRRISPYSSACQPNGGINDQGTIAGVCVLGPNSTELSSVATVWTPYGTPDGLHPGSGAGLVPAGVGKSISNTGYIAIQAYDPTLAAYLFTPTLQLEPLASLDIANVNGMFVNGVNDLGQAVGSASVVGNSRCGEFAVVWFTPDSVVNLGVCGAAIAISDNGVVVGSGELTDTSASFAFIWTASGGLQRLPNLFGQSTVQSSAALKINANNQILGSLIVGSTTVENPDTYTMLWTLLAPPAQITTKQLR